MNTSYPQKPANITVLGVMTLISGITNILASLGLTATIVLGTLGIGLLCAPVLILPLVLGIFEIIYAVKLISNPPQPTNPSQAIAIMEICCILMGNVIAVVTGILALVFYNDPQVRAYFDQIRPAN